MAKKKTKKEMRKSNPEEDMFRGREVEWKKTDGKIPYLETNIDRFYHHVKEKRSINFYDAAREFRVDKEQIASWSRILEEHKLAKVHYPVFGSPMILIGSEKPEKEGRREQEEEGKKERKPWKVTPKIAISLAGGLMVFFGYVMLVSNPFTITMRSQLALIIERFRTLFAFLPYPLNIITPVIIIVAVLWAIFGLRRRRKTPKVEDKLGKIKEELGS